MYRESEIQLRIARSTRSTRRIPRTRCSLRRGSRTRGSCVTDGQRRGVRVRRLRLRTPSEYSGALRFRRAAPAELGEEFCGAAESCSECSPASASQTRVRVVGRVGKPGKRSRPSRHSPTKGRRGACLELTGYVNLCLRRIHSA